MTDIHTCRAKTLDDNKWVYGYYVCLNKNEHRIYTGYAGIGTMAYFPEYFSVDPKTVGRFTGIQDCNEKDVYEGDTVSFTIFDFNDSDTQYVGIVKSVYGEWVLVENVPPTNIEEEEYGYNLYWVFNQYDEPEIIGNIHDEVKE